MKPEDEGQRLPRGQARATGTAPPPTPGALARKQRLAVIAMIVMALFWGYNWVVMKKVLAYAGPFDFTALRTLTGAIVLLLAVGYRRRPFDRRLLLAWRRVLLLGVLQTCLFSLVMQIALLQGGAGKTSVLAYTMPFWVVPAAWLVFGERIRGLQWLALATAAIGLLLVLDPWSGRGSVLSEVLAVLGGLFWALATIVAKWIRRDYAPDVLQLTAWQLLCGSLVLCFVTLAVPERPIEFSWYFWFALGYNGILATGLSWFLWLFALQHLSAGVASMMALAVPVISVLSGWIELGEQPAGAELLGMVLIGAALVAISLGSLLHAERKA